MSHLPLKALQAFEAAARLNNFSDAAKELCVTQSAVSHQVRRLEEWLGVRLFSRKGNALELLPVGEKLAATVTQSLGQIGQACSTARSSDRPLPLIIAAIPSIATLWLVPRLDEFRKTNPGIDVRVEYAFHGRSIDFSEVDFAFTFSDTVPTLAGARSGVYLSGAACAVCGPVIAATLQDTDLDADMMQSLGLLHDTDTSAWDAWFEKAGKPVPELSYGPVFHDFNLLRAATMAGQGIALCPEKIIEQDIANGNLVQISELTVRDEFNYYLMCSQTRRPTTDKTAIAFEKWAMSLRSDDPSVDLMDQAQ